MRLFILQIKEATPSILLTKAEYISPNRYLVFVTACISYKAIHTDKTNNYSNGTNPELGNLMCNKKLDDRINFR